VDRQARRIAPDNYLLQPGRGSKLGRSLFLCCFKVLVKTKCYKVTVDIAGMESPKLSLLLSVACRNQRGGLPPAALQKAGAKQLTHMTAFFFVVRCSRGDNWMRLGT
jgi:hypothetical protein